MAYNGCIMAGLPLRMSAPENINFMLGKIL